MIKACNDIPIKYLGSLLPVAPLSDQDFSSTNLISHFGDFSLSIGLEMFSKSNSMFDTKFLKKLFIAFINGLSPIIGNNTMW